MDAGISETRGWGDMLESMRAEVGAHCRATGRDTCCWMHVLAEEAYEALAEPTEDGLRQELVQLAAVCVEMIEVIDRKAEDK
jgi:hypothetical protein